MTTDIQLDLHETPFVTRVASDVRDFFTNAVNPDPILCRDNFYTRPACPFEAYSSGVLMSAGELFSACNQMELATQLLSGFRSRDNGDIVVTRYDYIIYHVENHVLRGGMIVDRCLKLANTVFELGNAPAQCKFDVIAKNAHVTTTSVVSTLKEIKKQLQDTQTERNSIAHFKTYDHEDLYHVGIHSTMLKSGEDEATAWAAHFIKTQADKFVAVKKTEMTSLNQLAKRLVGELFDSLVSPYNKRRSAKQRNAKQQIGQPELARLSVFQRRFLRLQFRGPVHGVVIPLGFFAYRYQQSSTCSAAFSSNLSAPTAKRCVGASSNSGMAT